MSSNPVSRRLRRGGTRQRPLPPPLYVFGVTALATFLVGLTVWPLTTGRHLQAVTMSRICVGPEGVEPGGARVSKTPASPPEDESSLRRQILSDENLRAALRRMKTPRDGLSSAEAASSSTDALEPLRRQLRVRLGAGPGPDAADIRVECLPSSDASGHVECLLSDSGRAAALLDAIARQWIESHAETQAREAARRCEPKPKRELVLARRDEGAAREALDRFLDSCFSGDAALDFAEPESDAANEGPAASPVGRRPTAPDPPEDPQWRRLRDELDHLQGRRAELMDRLTPEHPQMVQLEEDLAQTRRAWEQTARFRASPHGSGATESTPKPTPSAARQSRPSRDSSGARLSALRSQIARKRAESAETCEQLRRAYEAASRRREQLERAAEDAPRPSPIAATAWIVKKTRVAQRPDDDAPAGRLPIVGFLSLLVGVAAAWSSSVLRRRTGKGLTDVESIRRLLPVPVVGVLSTGERSPGPPAGRTRLLRGVTILCEVLLAAYLVACLIVAVTGAVPSMGLVEDPFHAACEVFARAASWRI